MTTGVTVVYGGLWDMVCFGHPLNGHCRTGVIRPCQVEGARLKRFSKHL